MSRTKEERELDDREAEAFVRSVKDRIQKEVEQKALQRVLDARPDDVGALIESAPSGVRRYFK